MTLPVCSSSVLLKRNEKKITPPNEHKKKITPPNETTKDKISQQNMSSQSFENRHGKALPLRNSMAFDPSLFRCGEERFCESSFKRTRPPSLCRRDSDTLAIHRTVFETRFLDRKTNVSRARYKQFQSILMSTKSNSILKACSLNVSRILLQKWVSWPRYRTRWNFLKILSRNIWHHC